MHSSDFIFQNVEREMFYKLLFVLNLQIFRQSFFAAIFWSVPGSLVIKKFKTWKVSKFAASVFPPLPTSDTRKLSFPSNLWIRGENNTEMIRSIYRRGEIGLVFISSFVGKYFWEVWEEGRQDSKLGHLESVERHFSVCIWRNFIKGYSQFIITITPYQVKNYQLKS